MSAVVVTKAEWLVLFQEAEYVASPRAALRRAILLSADRVVTLVTNDPITAASADRLVGSKLKIYYDGPISNPRLDELSRNNEQIEATCKRWEAMMLRKR